MVWKLKCDCKERVSCDINSMKLLCELQGFLDLQVTNGIFSEEKVNEPFYVWKKGKEEKKWFASKWYRCKECGCLWEIDYPDFPALGFVKLFHDGKHVTEVCHATENGIIE